MDKQDTFEMYEGRKKSRTQKHIVASETTSACPFVLNMCALIMHSSTAGTAGKHLLWALIIKLL